MAVQAAQQVKSAAPANAKAQPQQAPGAKQAAADPKSTQGFNKSVADAKAAPAQKPANASLGAGSGSATKSIPPKPLDQNQISQLKSDSDLLAKDTKDVTDTGNTFFKWGLTQKRETLKNDSAAISGRLNGFLDNVGANKDGTIFKMDDYYTSQMNPALDQVGAAPEYRNMVTSEIGKRSQQGVASRIADEIRTTGDQRSQPTLSTAYWNDGAHIDDLRNQSQQYMTAEIGRNVVTPVGGGAVDNADSAVDDLRTRLAGDPQIAGALKDVAQRYTNDPVTADDLTSSKDSYINANTPKP